MFDEKPSRKDLCGIDRATDGRTYCSNAARFLIRPSCACEWQVSACGNHVAAILRSAAGRPDAHFSKEWLQVAPLVF